MEWSHEFLISFVLAVVPILWGIVKWFWNRFFSKKKRALSLEYVDSKQYFNKKNDKIELRVIYNNSLPCDSLVTLRVAIKNSGKEDISSVALIDPVKISCSDKYEILDVSRVEEYSKIKPSIIFTPSSVSISWALLKHESKFEIDIIAKSTTKNRDLSVNFYNSLYCDINIEGVDDIRYERQFTTEDKELRRFRKKIKLLAVYSIMLMLFAIRTYSFPDYTSYLSLQADSLSMESRVDVYSRNKTIKIHSSDEHLLIQEFNDRYTITGIADKYPNNNNVFYIIYFSGAVICALGTITLSLMYIKRKYDKG